MAGYGHASIAKSGKNRSELGYKPQETVKIGIRKTLDWYLDNEPGGEIS